MQFIIHAYDATDEHALERRMAVRPSHLEGIKKVKETGSVVCAGGMMNAEGKTIGSFLVMDFPSRELFDQYLKNEPYVVNGVWEKITVECCSVVIMNDEKVGA